MKRSVNIIFTLSVVLNLLLIGVIGGYIYKKQNEPGSWHQVKETLAPETKKIMRDSFKRKEMIAMFMEARKKRSEIEKVLTAEEFDPVAYDALAQEIQAMNTQFSAKRLEHIKRIATKLPQEERKKLAKHAVSKLFGKSGHRKGKRKFKDGTQKDMQRPFKSDEPDRSIEGNDDAKKETNP